MRNSTANEIHRQHLLILPYPSTSHVIPLLDLTHRLLTGGLTVTLLATPPLIPLLRPLLSLHPPPFLQTLLLSPPDAPQNRLIPKLRALRELYDPILEWIRSQASPPNAIVSNFFLGWANQLAREAGVPHIVFSPCGALGTALFYALWRDLPRNDDPENENFEVCFDKLPNSPTQRWWQLSHVYRSLKEGDPDWEFFRESALANLSSWGTVVNSFTELDRVYIDYFKREMGHNRVWAVGPLLPREDDDTSRAAKRGGPSTIPAEEVLAWLEERPDCSVVYVCFGSRMSPTKDQTAALGTALECSGVHFIWCVHESDSLIIPDGYEDRVAGRGLIIRGWAPQLVILRHRAAAAFVTHCGWNSAMESMAAGVMMLAWPLGADQFINAQLLVDQLGVALRVNCEGPASVPDSAELSRLLGESVSETRPERERVRKLRVAAMDAVEEGGSSHENLNELVEQLSQWKG